MNPLDLVFPPAWQNMLNLSDEMWVRIFRQEALRFGEEYPERHMGIESDDFEEIAAEMRDYAGAVAATYGFDTLPTMVAGATAVPNHPEAVAQVMARLICCGFIVRTFMAGPDNNDDSHPGPREVGG